MVLCWGEGHGSAIHDHANAHCVMKVLQGELCEVSNIVLHFYSYIRSEQYFKTVTFPQTRYNWPKECNDETEEPEELKELERNTLGLNEICYINGIIYQRTIII